MTDLTSRTMGTCYNLTIHNDSSADTGSKRHHYNAVKSAAAAFPLLAKSCHICVITNFDFLNPCQSGYLICHRKDSPAEICAFQNNTLFCNRSRYTHADSKNIFCRNIFLLILFFDRCRNIRQNLLSAIFFVCHDLPFIDHGSFFIKKSHLYRCSPDINTIYIVCHSFLHFFLMYSPNLLNEEFRAYILHNIL